MEIDIKKILKLSRLLLLVLAFTFSSNINATALTGTNTALNLTASTVNATALTFGSWGWGKKKKKRRRNRCSRCQRHNCTGHGGGGDQIPLDGGLGILVIGAAAFGARKLRGKKNDKI